MNAHTIPHNSIIPQQKVKVKFQKSHFSEKDLTTQNFKLEVHIIIIIY